MLSTVFCASMLAGTFIPAAASASSLNEWLNQKTMTGDWNGGRTRLADAGVTFQGGYVGEFADVLSGGKRQGNGYAQEFSLGMKLDLNKLFGLTGGSFDVGFSQRQGRSVASDFIGNSLAPQEIYGAGETLHITQMTYSQFLLNDKVRVQLGFTPLGNNFGQITYGGLFQNVGFCSHLQNVPRSSGWADSPQPHWGGQVLIKPNAEFYFQTGLYDVNPTYGERQNGLKVSMSGSTGVIIPVEFGYTPTFDGLVGHYKAGFYYDNSKHANAVYTNDIDKGRYGWYLLADQMLVNFGANPDRGLAAFGGVSYSDPQTSTFRGSILGGLIVKGPLSARPHDFIELGYSRLILNHRLIRYQEATNPTLTDLSTGESVMEIGYGLQATPWLLVHPNIQYIMDPGTFSYNKNISNAWVFGLQTKMVF